MILLRKKLDPYILVIFLLLETVLYGCILTTHGKTLVVTEYASIIGCFLLSLVYLCSRNALLCCGLLFTLMADFCLVICDPIQQLWGMVFFLLAQSCYAWMLHKEGLPQWILPLRIGMTAVVLGVAFVVLGKNTDALALVSMAYYVNLIVNLLCAFLRFSSNRLMAIGFVCFLLCDTVIGLQTAAGAYLPIAEGSWLYGIIFMDFHLSWFFYLPSQVLIALHGRKKMRKG